MCETRLVRADFPSRAEWLRYLHEGGFIIEEEEPGFAGVVVSNEDERVFGALYGSTPRAYERAWGGRGVADSLSEHQVREFYAALAFANCLGLVVDSRVDVSWSTVGVEDDIAVFSAQKRWMDGIRHWLTRNGVFPAFGWVIERGAKLGLHTHLVLHLPANRDLQRRFKGFAASCLRAVVKRELSGRPRRTINVETRCGPRTVSQWIRFEYMCKGLHAGSQGVTRQKRLGVSRALGPSERSKWLATNMAPSLNGDDHDWARDDRFLDWHRQHSEDERQRAENESRWEALAQKTGMPFSIA